MILTQADSEKTVFRYGSKFTRSGKVDIALIELYTTHKLTGSFSLLYLTENHPVILFAALGIMQIVVISA
ncbi:hypothetical protein [Iodobacter sp.]|uniref:hypothetical protein n=1 Tax=Iodobacter sp. TaxID=1915058 RepID=UPI0025E5E256|nr:hypothetical protein [Iodobacter sp.]